MKLTTTTTIFARALNQVFCIPAAKQINTASSEKLTSSKAEGDISSVFTSLSGARLPPLPERYAELKSRLIAGNEDKINATFCGLISQIKSEIEFKDINQPSQEFRDALKKHGVAVVRGVVEPEVALKYKADLRDYTKKNPKTKAFPPDDPQVFELYWSHSQMAARAHPNLLSAQSFLMSFWHSVTDESLISTKFPLSYADRLRIRNPGDNKFALGPHVDGSSVERWEEHGYGKGGVYDRVFQGKLNEFDPWESSARLKAVQDNYAAPSACSCFRMFQGWLSMSTTAPGEGTLLVNPLFDRATAYYLLRPFFEPIRGLDRVSKEQYLRPENWRLMTTQDSAVEDAYPGTCFELSDEYHPHLELGKSMVHVPTVNPGDYVAWHCDTIHAVDTSHRGKSDSSVLYIPATPLTLANAKYIAIQREHFMRGIPAPDFPGGVGESEHVGRMNNDDTDKLGKRGRQAMGLEEFQVELAKDDVEWDLLKKCNEILSYRAGKSYG